MEQEPSSSSKDLILITVSGPDRPGITASLMKILATGGHVVRDIGQAVTHGLLSLSILIDTRTNQEISNNPKNDSHHLTLLKDLLFEAKKQGLSLEFEAIENGFLGANHKSEIFILSCVSVRPISANFLCDISTLLANQKINITRIDNISGHEFKSIEITTSTPPDISWKKLKSQLLNIGDTYQIDLAFLKDNVFRRNKRLIAFDMDSTLIQTEVIVEMAKKCGQEEQVHQITEQAMNGEIDFDSSLKRRVQSLKGLSLTQMQEIAENLPLTPGAEDFIKMVKKLGYKVAVISGGFNFFANYLKDKLGLHYAFANDLEMEGDKLTGKLKGPIVNAQQKAVILELIAQQENIHLEQVVAVGDGANDLPMLLKAGLGIAFHAKEKVKQSADHYMGHGPMTSILYFLGLPGNTSLNETFKKHS